MNLSMNSLPALALLVRNRRSLCQTAQEALQLWFVEKPRGKINFSYTYGAGIREKK
jgi:hypothetical protein